MKIGVSSYSFSKLMKANGLDYIAVCDKAKELGFDGIEFTEINSKKPLQTAADIRKHCEEIGLEITAYSIGANFNTPFPCFVVNKLKKQIDIAAALGAPLMRHDVCDKLYGKQTYRSVIYKIAPYIRKVSEYAMSKGIATCTENHGSIFQHSQRMVELFREVNHPNYALLCDVGNFLCADESPKFAVQSVAPYVIHVHAKDFFRRSKEEGEAPGYFRTAYGSYLKGTTIGKGIVPVDVCLQELYDAGFAGFVSVEYEGDEDCIEALKEALVYLKALPVFDTEE